MVQDYVFRDPLAPMLEFEQFRISATLQLNPSNSLLFRADRLCQLCLHVRPQLQNEIIPLLSNHRTQSDNEDEFDSTI